MFCCWHKWNEVMAFAQDYGEDDDNITSSVHCASGFECNKCGERKIEKTKPYKDYRSIHPIKWQEILDWKNDIKPKAQILRLVK